jgi:hypothetical protein
MTTKQGLQVPETNKTSLGLYVTPQEAYVMWKADPSRVNIIDVRTFEEYTFVGHLEMARNIPFVFPRYKPPALPHQNLTLCSLRNTLSAYQCHIFNRPTPALLFLANKTGSSYNALQRSDSC